MDDTTKQDDAHEETETISAAEVQTADDTPTPEQARALFAERQDAAGVLTTEGWMRRDGTLV